MTGIPIVTSGNGLLGKLGTWLLVLATGGLLLVLGVETFNALYYGPWSDDYFLFRTAGILADLDIEPLTYLMFGSLLVLLMMGLPLAFVTGGLGVVFIYLVGDAAMLNIIPGRIFPLMANPDLAAIPLFIFMATLLERAGLIEEMFSVVYKWMGGIHGGLAAATILASTILAAMVGVIGAAVVTMGIIALPAMLKYGYDKGLACGAIAASGTLGQIIPPSIILILLGDVVGVPVGELFAAAVVPGLILVAGFIVYILIIAYLRPNLAPTLPTRDDGAGLGRQVLKSLLPPLFLVVAVLGSIFFGVASPTESAAVGALGAMILAALHKRMTYKNLRDTANQTTRLTSMVFMILVGATAFGLVFRSMGGDFVVEELMMEIPGGKWGFIAVSMLTIFTLGFFLDFLEICFIVVPILAPIAEMMDINMLWFAVLIAMNLQTSFLTPPFGFSLFYLKATAPPEVKIQHIYRGVIPFVLIQVTVLGLLIAFPDIVQWLPDLVNEWSDF